MTKRLTLIIMFTIFLGVLLSAALPKIFVVYSYDKYYAWNTSLANAVQETLETVESEVQSYYMDTRLRNDEQWKIKSGQIALEQMKDFDPDVIITCDDNAQQYFVNLIPEENNTPVVFCGVNNDPSIYGYSNEKTTGVLERPFPLKSLNLAKAIDSNIKTVAFIGDDTNTTDGFIEFLKKQDLGDFQNVGFFQYDRFEKMLKDIKILEKFANALYFIRTTEFKDAEGNIINTKQAMEMINQVTDKPIIGINDYIIYDGALCGVVPDPDFHGTLAAQMALQIAAGEKVPSDYPIITYHSTFNDKEDGLSIVNLNTAHDKNIQVPVEVANKADVLVSSLDRLDRIALDYYQLIAGHFFTDVNTFFNDLSSKPYSKKGDWPLIKKDMEKRLETIKRDNEAYNYPGIYLYIKPDGSYYSNIRNLTGENISDRPYFYTLLKGNPVKGFPIISRSTGVKSCLFAFPSFEDSKLTGFVGMSLYMEPLNAHLNKKMDLSDDIVYFAIKADKMVLSSDESYLFSPIEDYIDGQKDQFLSKIVNTKTGTIAFIHGKGLYYGIFDTQDVTEWKYVYAKKIYDFSQNSSSIDMRRNLLKVSDALSQKISQMEENLLEASNIFANSEDLPADIRGILNSLYNKSPDIFDVAYVNTDLVMQYMAPEKYRHLEGSDISHQQQMQQIAKTKKPQVSKLFMTVEDLYGIDVEWPVFNKKGDWKGSLSMLVEPHAFFGKIIQEHLKNTDYEIWIMQQDGTIIYDIDREEINENIFEEGIYSDYKELQRLGRQIIAQKEGHGSYTFLETGSDIPVSKEAYWNTLDFHGNIWKVVITRMFK